MLTLRQSRIRIAAGYSGSQTSVKGKSILRTLSETSEKYRNTNLQSKSSTKPELQLSFAVNAIRMLTIRCQSRHFSPISCQSLHVAKQRKRNNKGQNHWQQGVSELVPELWNAQSLIRLMSALLMEHHEKWIN